MIYVIVRLFWEDGAQKDPRIKFIRGYMSGYRSKSSVFDVAERREQVIAYCSTG